jgi:flavin-dependent dehydrogenase
MQDRLGPINSESVVVIIGGGPAGSSCAIRLKRICAAQKICPRIIVYENKRFEKKSYYNQCLGVLSPPIEAILESQLEIPFPSHIVQKVINGYYIHSDHRTLKLPGEHEPSYACRRVEFDNYLFQKARKLGVETIPARVTEIDFSPEGVMVYSESNNIKADVVVGAFGLDDGMAETFGRLTSYRQPDFLFSVVTKIHVGESALQDFGQYLHAFLPLSLPHVEFGAMTPKGNHLTCNIAGKHVDAEMMDRLLQLPVVKGNLPDDIDEILRHLYYFKGKFPTLPAKSFYGNRFVMVGDAAGLNRPFKGKGINSAIITGIRAADTMVRVGISKRAFEGYRSDCCELTDDIPYGKALRFFANLAKRWGFMGGVLEVAETEPALRTVLFNIVSGHETYKKTWSEAGRFRFFVRITLKVLGRRFRRPKKSDKR